MKQLVPKLKIYKYMTEDNIVIPLPKAILFDWDNTIVDSWNAIYKAINSTLVKYGRNPWTFEEVKQNVHRSLRDSFPVIFPVNWQEVATVYRQYYRDFSKEDLEVLPNARETLDLIREKNLYTALISNKKADILNIEVKHFDFTQYFEKIIGAGDLSEDKPSPITIETALRGTGIPVDKNVWFVGDSLTDMETAYNAGCVAVFFGDDDYKSERYAHCKPHLSFNTHKELISYLKKA